MSIGAALAVGLFVGKNSWAGVIFVLAMPFILVWPVQVSLGLFALLVPFDSVSVIGPASSGMTLTFVAGGVGTVILFFVALIGRRAMALPRPAFWWGLFVVWSLASVMWAVSPEDVWYRVPTALALLTLYLAATFVRITAGELSTISWLTILGGCAAASLAVYQFYSGVFYEDSTRGSIILGGRQGDPNFFAAALLLPVSLAFGRLISCRDWPRRLILSGTVLVIGLGVFVTMSRGAFVALAAMMLVYLFRLRANWRVLLPIAVVLVLVAAVPQLLFSRLEESTVTSGTGRVDIWIVGLSAFWHHPFLGVGLNNFPAAFDAYVGSAPIFRGFHRAAHNTFLSILVESGTVGLLLFVWALWFELRSVWQASKQQRTVDLLPYFAALCAVLVSGFFLDMVWSKTFWLVAILLTVAERCPRMPETETA
jgi:putative inorganic carbon (HCO3(-)) transporter